MSKLVFNDNIYILKRNPLANVLFVLFVLYSLFSIYTNYPNTIEEITVLSSLEIITLTLTLIEIMMMT